MPSLAALVSPVTVQVRNRTVCWETVFTAPFIRQDATKFSDKSD